MYEALISHLRECAKYDKSENTFKEAANAIEKLCGLCASQSKDCSEAVAKYLELWAKQPHWIPVTERLPEKECKNYWCYTNAGVMCECRWTNSKYGFGISDNWGWSVMDVPQYQRVTHWMPLPKQPEEE